MCQPPLLQVKFYSFVLYASTGPDLKSLLRKCWVNIAQDWDWNIKLCKGQGFKESMIDFIFNITVCVLPNFEYSFHVFCSSPPQHSGLHGWKFVRNNHISCITLTTPFLSNSSLRPRTRSWLYFCSFAHLPGNLCTSPRQPLHISPATFAHLPGNPYPHLNCCQTADLGLEPRVDFTFVWDNNNNIINEENNINQK